MSIVIDFSRSRALMRAAKKHQSQALEADALHFSTDIWSSSVVLLGLGCVWLADRIGAPWLKEADSVAALGVAAIVVWVCAQMGKRTIDDLLDAVPPGLREDVVRAAMAPGVVEVLETRVRRAGAEAFVDISLSVSRGSAFEQAHDVTIQVEERVRKVLPGAHVTVHPEPVKAGNEDIEDEVRVLAGRQGLNVHNVRVFERDGKPRLELHLEVNKGLTVAEAHAQAESFEARVREAHSRLGRITTHLEPAHDSIATASKAGVSKEEVRAALLAASRECELRCQPHDLEVSTVDGELAVTCHCWIDAAAPITAAHALTQKLELGLRARLPKLGRVVIHVEPDPKQAQ
jgi:divalent metal cation (Fe/Co/Zn/Cd) transporter